MAKEDYVAVAADDWYQRRRQDAEGEFFRSVADQGPQKGVGGSTRQGIYCFTPGGKLLVFKNAGQNAAVMREVFEQGLKEWKKLPEAERQPGAVKVDELTKIDRRYTRNPPPNGLTLNVYARALEKSNGNELGDAACKVGDGDEASRDHAWITEAEWKSLLPADAVKGKSYPLPKAIGERLLRFHLVDNTRGEPLFWKREEVRSSDLALVVEEATESLVRLRVEGKALLHTDSNARGYDVALLGYLHYNRRSNTVERFDLVALGDHWGDGAVTGGGGRAGKAPLGIALTLCRGDAPADRVPPQAVRDQDEYFAPQR